MNPNPTSVRGQALGIVASLLLLLQLSSCGSKSVASCSLGLRAFKERLAVADPDESMLVVDSESKDGVVFVELSRLLPARETDAGNAAWLDTPVLVGSQPGRWPHSVTEAFDLPELEKVCSSFLKLSDVNSRTIYEFRQRSGKPTRRFEITDVSASEDFRPSPAESGSMEVNSIPA